MCTGINLHKLQCQRAGSLMERMLCLSYITSEKWQFHVNTMLTPRIFRAQNTNKIPSNTFAQAVNAETRTTPTHVNIFYSEKINHWTSWRHYHYIVNSKFSAFPKLFEYLSSKKTEYNFDKLGSFKQNISTSQTNNFKNGLL
ncbi:hypothetical protein CDAR_199651 [Caerostris darwini]|uniref:Uncharacterized protein n=1 Tax=Caerostris darwini TaxID=1538125 RepID=A0AAV4V5M4_9ARAC|nr:hypothetical protein CDAR_199651 [Caerostris darwini]